MARSIVLLENSTFISADRLLLDGRGGLPDITFGAEAFDSAFPLNFGQFAVFQGRSAHSICLLLCVRAALPQPLGPNCDSIFIDGGNNFDPYAISNNSVEQGLDPESVLGRVHVSRAFTHHQLACIILDKLSSAIEAFKAKLVIVSDITQLYCDPDLRDDDKDDSIQLFKKTVRTLRMLARQHQSLIVATNFEQRNPRMDRDLAHAAHVSARVEQKPHITQLSLLKQPCLSSRTITATTGGCRVLESFV